MGEARSRLTRVIATQPKCTYCGVGETTSVDHCPPIALFDARRRPAGLEFGACEACHSATRGIDNVAALVARTHAGSSQLVVEDLQKYLQAVHNNYPSIYQAMVPSSELGNATLTHLGIDVDMSRADPSELHRAMVGFAGRFGLAIYRYATGAVAPTDSKILACWFSSFDILTGARLLREFSSIGPSATLRQGGFEVANQFRFNSVWYLKNGICFATYAEFRSGLGVFCQVQPELDHLPNSQQPNMGVLSTDFLQSFTPLH